MHEYKKLEYTNDVFLSDIFYKTVIQKIESFHYKSLSLSRPFRTET